MDAYLLSVGNVFPLKNALLHNLATFLSRRAEVNFPYQLQGV
jgi:hypothetical protein